MNEFWPRSQIGKCSRICNCALISIPVVFQKIFFFCKAVAVEKDE